MSFIDGISPEVLEKAWEIMEQRRKEALSKKLGRRSFMFSLLIFV